MAHREVQCGGIAPEQARRNRKLRSFAAASSIEYICGESVDISTTMAVVFAAGMTFPSVTASEGVAPASASGGCAA